MRAVRSLDRFVCAASRHSLPKEPAPITNVRRGCRRDVRDTVPNQKLKVHWAADGSTAWFRVDLGRGEHEFRLVSTDTGRIEPVFDHALLAKGLGKELKRELDPKRLRSRNSSLRMT